MPTVCSTSCLTPARRPPSTCSRARCCGIVIYAPDRACPLWDRRRWRASSSTCPRDRACSGCAARRRPGVDASDQQRPGGLPGGVARHRLRRQAVRRDGRGFRRHRPYQMDVTRLRGGQARAWRWSTAGSSSVTTRESCTASTRPGGADLADADSRALQRLPLRRLLLLAGGRLRPRVRRQHRRQGVLVRCAAGKTRGRRPCPGGRTARLGGRRQGVRQLSTGTFVAIDARPAPAVAPQLAYNSLSSPVVIGPLVYVADRAEWQSSRRRVRLRPRHGRIGWQFHDGKYSPAIAAAGRLVVVGFGGCTCSNRGGSSAGVVGGGDVRGQLCVVVQQPAMGDQCAAAGCQVQVLQHERRQVDAGDAGRGGGGDRLVDQRFELVGRQRRLRRDRVCDDDRRSCAKRPVRGGNGASVSGSSARSGSPDRWSGRRRAGSGRCRSRSAARRSSRAARASPRVQQRPGAGADDADRRGAQLETSAEMSQDVPSRDGRRQSRLPP